ARKMLEGAPTLGKRAIKNPNREWLRFGCWWWDENPRQTMLYERIRNSANCCGKLHKSLVCHYLIRNLIILFP
ncbi:hypothetical protein, partial [Nitrosomonas communis]|uniref:hypothetical protein n=1 Tax=Nitrosomonas communis TaxID=44574 RepID=UPI001C433566